MQSVGVLLITFLAGHIHVLILCNGGKVSCPHSTRDLREDIFDDHAGIESISSYFSSRLAFSRCWLILEIRRPCWSAEIPIVMTLVDEVGYSMDQDHRPTATRVK